MTIIIKLRERDYQIEGELPLYKVYKRLNIPSRSVLAVRNGLLLTEDELLHEKDYVELIEVISGG
jgi:sulfur carrier protein ThiS